MPSIAFNFGGLVGTVLIDPHERYREYSMISTGAEIKEDVGAIYYGQIFLTAVYFIFAFVGPILRIVGYVWG